MCQPSAAAVATTDTAPLMPAPLSCFHFMVAGDETPLRTSWGMFITGQLQEHPVARHVDARVTALACGVEGRGALTLGEATQIVRYDPGQVATRLWGCRARGQQAPVVCRLRHGKEVGGVAC
jgi:hypothetical protein